MIIELLEWPQLGGIELSEPPVLNINGGLVYQLGPSEEEMKLKLRGQTVATCNHLLLFNGVCHTFSMDYQAPFLRLGEYTAH